MRRRKQWYEEDTPRAPAAAAGAEEEHEGSYGYGASAAFENILGRTPREFSDWVATKRAVFLSANYFLFDLDENYKKPEVIQSLVQARALDLVTPIQHDELELRSVIGKGSSGQIYLATYKGFPVAAKFLINQDSYDLFIAEVASLSLLRHLTLPHSSVPIASMNTLSL
jgi:hypothetical protein